MLLSIACCAALAQEPPPSAPPSARPAAEMLRLENGLIVALHPDPAAPAVVVLLGVKAGVHDEPEGRSGLAHLAEHLFLHGGTASAEAGTSFAKLAEGGPLGQPYADVNAETLWNLTYFYALRRPNEVDLPLDLFAEKLGGVAFDDGLLEVERAKALQEVESAERAMESSPMMREQMRAMYRRPKAGITAELSKVGEAEILAFLARHYRPERMVLLVEGSFDPERVRAKIRELYGALRAREAPALEHAAPDGTPIGALRCTALPEDMRNDAATMAVFGAAWKHALRPSGRAYFELGGGGDMRVYSEKGTPESIAEALKGLTVDLEAKALQRYVREAGREVRQFQKLVEQERYTGEDRARAIQSMAQRAIYRVRVEAEGGQAFLDRLAQVTPQGVAAFARRL